ncbi:hypothetical protein TELCIR_04208 [Teladorsagia circumcincta]|uniref:PIH1 N-terminal domain-containing protein n=1 Tax=Teladorsagia circumcincta TaxID=45464 RepID=A0A2G9UU62_TELCI|nr:hypothetical protein TELCIR_04208 [Teladorsagia circumcincta]
MPTHSTRLCCTLVATGVRFGAFDDLQRPKLRARRVHDELAARIDKGDVGYRIPVSIGELDSVVDNKNVNQPKIDVLVNSVFYEKRLAPPAANFFRHFFCMVVCDAIEDKHHLKLDPNKCVKLKNRTVMGCIEPMKIAKRPVAPVIQEIASIDSKPEEPEIPVSFLVAYPKTARSAYA